MRHETELKWIKFLQSPLPLGLIIIYTMNVMFLKCLILMGFFLLEIKKRKSRSRGKRKAGNIKLKMCTGK